MASRSKKGAPKKDEKTELWEIKNLLYFCSEGHEKAETVSTDIMRWMCPDHLPVYLFSSIEDPVLQRYHLEVSIAFKTFSFFLTKLHVLYLKKKFTKLELFLKNRKILHTQPQTRLFHAPDVACNSTKNC